MTQREQIILGYQKIRERQQEAGVYNPYRNSNPYPSDGDVNPEYLIKEPKDTDLFDENGFY